MGFLTKGWHWFNRASAAVGTVGLSEAYRAKYGKADPLAASTERNGDKIVGKADKELGNWGNSSPDSSSVESPEDKEYRQRLQTQRDADLGEARAYRDRLADEPDAQPRQAPQVDAPARVRPARVAGPGNVAAGTVGATTVGTAVDTADADQARQAQQAQLGYLDAVQHGEAGPSAAEKQLRLGNAQAVAAQYALAAGHKGYSGAALRAAGRNAASTMQTTNAQAGALRAQEQATARDQYGNLLTQGRSQDITQSGTVADIGLRGAIANQSSALEAAKANQGSALEAAKANQTAKLQTDLAQANIDQQTILHASDQELQARLANAGFTLNQEQIDDLRLKTQRDQQIQATGQVLAGSAAAAAGSQEAALKLQELEARRQEAKAKGDAAEEQMYATLIASYLSYASDRRGKTNVSEVSPAESKRFLGSVAQMYRYRYKDPGAPGAAPGVHYGPMAQDLESSGAIGRSVVSTGPDGKKRIDAGRLILALASAVAASTKEAR
jgi:hypothetical protein